MRQAHGYPYLSSAFKSLWLDGLSVAHQLLARHEEKHGYETYYQDSFGTDYIAALADPQFGTEDIMFDGVTEPSMAHLHRNDQPAWQAFAKAREDLKSAPRGAIALLDDGRRWHIRLHAGEGYISECKTMRCAGPKPTAREIQECLLSYEGYLARKHAGKEREILRNFARLRELNLQPGQTVRDVELPHNGKRAKISFKIQSISDTGYLSLTDGMLRGSSSRLNGSVAACQITANQVQAPEPKKVAVPVDLDTAPLF
jgi:hypothetical protein